MADIVANYTMLVKAVKRFIVQALSRACVGLVQVLFCAEKMALDVFSTSRNLDTFVANVKFVYGLNVTAINVEKCGQISRWL